MLHARTITLLEVNICANVANSYSLASGTCPRNMTIQLPSFYVNHVFRVAFQMGHFIYNIFEVAILQN